MNIRIVIGLLIPFAGTSLGAAMVFLLKNSVSQKLQRILTGFAAGVMVAASFWSLLQPALESSESMGKLSFIPAAVGFLIGIGFLLLLDMVTPHMHMNQEGEGPKSTLKRTTKLILAVTLHNIPEGMAVGVVYANIIAGIAFCLCFMVYGTLIFVKSERIDIATCVYLFKAVVPDHYRTDRGRLFGGKG